ncbi:MAG: hypothetical protein QOC65_295 [Sphingomonadales bacterium]|nr:hypothetical protein [Sphingomonadales bacterium]
MHLSRKCVGIGAFLLAAACNSISQDGNNEVDAAHNSAEQNRLDAENAVAQERILAQEQEQQRVQAELAAHRAAIVAVLVADAQAGRLGSLARTAAAMRLIDVSQAPSDFREAYLLHTQAWEDTGRYDAELRYLNSPEASNEAWRRWWVETLRGTDGTPVTDLEAAKATTRDRRAQANERIHLTFQEVERIAVRYGAQLPRRPANAAAANEM